MPSWPGFINGSYQAENFLADQEDTINFFVERMESPGALSRQVLRPTPGFKTFATLPDINTSGAKMAGSRAFVVTGPSLYELFVDGTYTNRGTVKQNSNPATISYNGTAGHQLFITSGGDGYCFDLNTNTLTDVLSGTATMGAFANDYFLAFNIATGNVQLSALQDGSSWPGQSFSRSLFPDPWQALFVDNQGLLWLPGTETFEVWYFNPNNFPQPFAPLTGQVGRYGIGAPFAWAVCGSEVLWLSANAEGGAIVIAPQQAGGTAVSNYAIAQALSGAQRTAKISDAEAFSYQEGGHTFFVLALPSVPQTWAYDVDKPMMWGETARLTPAGNWAKRGRWDVNENRYDLWSPRVHLYAFGKHLVGDRTTGIIAEMTSSVAMEIDGSGIRRLRQAPVLPTEYQRHPIDFFQLVCDTGLGTSAGQGATPEAMLRVSTDGGRTWGNELWAGAGPMGTYGKRVYWTRLGAGAVPTLQVVMTDPVPWRITDAYLNNVEQVA